MIPIFAFLAGVLLAAGVARVRRDGVRESPRQLAALAIAVVVFAIVLFGGATWAGLDVDRLEIVLGVAAGFAAVAAGAIVISTLRRRAAAPPAKSPFDLS